MGFIAKAIGSIVLASVATGCAVQQQPYDYTAFKESNPRSILVLPPANASPDVLASDSVFSQVTRPLAESGYYVFPVAVVSETFKANGITDPDETHHVNLSKINEIFGPDAVLYLTVTDYGTSYQVVQSDSRVTIQAKLIDAKTGKNLWEGSATASSTEQSSSSAHPLVLLLQVALEQIINTTTNKSHSIAQLSNHRLLHASKPNGILYGPRSTLYWKK
ncbi:DUF799 domain-containing protein [Advenella sp. RU8]|uniref:DUF799 domain-containing protein n=1 Tax=Advenella sp. RU8 TaxID=3399575 RepID=UPI003AAA8912